MNLIIFTCNAVICLLAMPSNATIWIVDVWSKSIALRWTPSFAIFVTFLYTMGRGLSLPFTMNLMTNMSIINYIFINYIFFILNILIISMLKLVDTTDGFFYKRD